MSQTVHIIDHTDATALRPGDVVVLVHRDDGRRVEGDLRGMWTIGGRTLTRVKIETVAMTADYVIAPHAWMVATVYRLAPAPDQAAVLTTDDVVARLAELAEQLEDIAAAAPAGTPTALADQLELVGLVDAARAVVDHWGERGALARQSRLLDVITQARAADPRVDVLMSAAVWLDRSGSQGAPQRLRFLADALDRIPTDQNNQAQDDGAMLPPTP